MISREYHSNNIDLILHMFKGVEKGEVERPKGEIDVLIGYNYASLHPHVIQAAGNLLLLENRFGRCIAGSHQMIEESCKVLVDTVEVYHVTNSEASFFDIEDMGIQCFPRCGNCSCKKCSLGSKGLSIKEEREQNLICQGLTYHKEDQLFVAKYPWIKDPNSLPNNYYMTFRRLECTERRLNKNLDNCKIYNEQENGMLQRNVARILSEEEIKNYKGPFYYLCHHEVLKKSSSTPCRIVFNSSAKFMNSCLNDYWAKGAKLLNDLLGILFRFRENKVVICGDIRKMYHSVKISILDQHTHRFLWRNMETYRDPDTYVMTAVSFDDKPAGNIAMAHYIKQLKWGSIYIPGLLKHC